MSKIMSDTALGLADGGPLVEVHRVRRIPVLALGIALSIFLPLSYALCLMILFLFPHFPFNHSVLIFFVPSLEDADGYTLLMGLVEAVADAWWIALGFGSIYNFLVGRLGR
jgi:hypothetical protein